MQAHGRSTVMSELHGAMRAGHEALGGDREVAVRSVGATDDGTGEVVGRPVEDGLLRY